MLSNVAWKTRIAATMLVGIGFSVFVPPTTMMGKAQRSTRALPSSLAFTGVTVIDVDRGNAVADQTVLIVGSRISAVGQSSQVRLPKDVQVVDARGKYLIPGLWDMHAHLFESPLYPLFIAHGVTGVRQPGWCCVTWPATAMADSFGRWQRETASGLRIGPRSVGPSADIRNIKISSVEDARRIVDSLSRAGDVFVKFHDDAMPRDLYFAFMREVRRTGLRIAGHLPIAVTTVEAIDSGHYGIDHFNEIRCWITQDTLTPSTPKRDTVAIARDCAPTIAKLVERKSWVVPTLFITTFGDAGALFPPRPTVRFVGMMHRRGVRMLAGTDVHTNVLKHRGFLALHRELQLLVDAGLTPLEALRTATINPAMFLQATDSLGTIAPGKLADLVLLDADPLVDIRHTTKIQAVVANGRYFDRHALDVIDSAATAAGALESSD